jgi:hypothetical protein
MRKLILFILPLMILCVQGCSNEYSLETISMSYVSPQNEIIDAKGGEIVVEVSSSYSYQLSCSPEGVCSFFRNGEVQYDKEGFAIVDLKHEIYVSANNSDKPREFFIIATHKHNPEIKASLRFWQLAEVND